MMKRSKIHTMLAALVVATALAGCGSNPSGVDPSTDDGSYVDPGTSTSPIGSDPTTGTNPYTGIPTTTVPTTPSVPLQDMTATVTTKKNGFFLGIGSLTCTVEVSNPNSVARTGTLTVTWTNGGKSGVTAPTTQQVSLGPNETQDLNFTDKSWRDDDMTATVTSDPVSGTASTGAPLGSTYGTSPTGYYRVR